MIARESGLLPLAQWLLHTATGADIKNPIKTAGYGSGASSEEVRKKAGEFINPEKKINSADDALTGARDILAEIFNETAEFRKELRRVFQLRAMMTSRASAGKKKSGAGKG